MSLDPILLGLRGGRSAFAAVAFTAVAATGAVAQQSGTVARVAGSPPPPNVSTETRLTPFVWLPSASGNAAVLGNGVDVDSNFRDSFDDHLGSMKLGSGFRFESESDTFSMFGEFTYVKFEEESGSSPKSEAEFANRIYDLGASFKLFDNRIARGTQDETRCDLVTGIRVNDLESELELPAIGLTASSRRNWADFFVGARLRWQVQDWLQIFARGDAGIGDSDAMWNALGGLDFRLGKSFSLQAGYRWYSVDYDAGSGSRKFVYDFLIRGPFLGLTFIF